MSAPSARSSIQVRPMRLEDLKQVQAIDRLSFSLPWPESAYRYEIERNPQSLLWVAEAGLPGGVRQVVGLIVIWLIVDEVHIATIAVHPDYRRAGVARELLATALRQGFRRGMSLATLEVRAGNAAAQELYRQFRFAVAGRRVRYYRDNQEDALIMTLANLDQSYLDWLEKNLSPTKRSLENSSPGDTS